MNRTISAHPRRYALYVTSLFIGILASASADALAENFKPDLGQTYEWLADYNAEDAVEPLDAPEAAANRLPPEQIQEERDEVRGRPFHDLDNPPSSRSYYKYPIYLALGFPRDLVDGVFGFLSFWPVVNLPVVGIGYEVLPTQYIMRDPRDWHRWGGRRNKNDHGWIDSAGWGWFPTAHQMQFRHVNKRKLARWKGENDELHSELANVNREIRASNKAIRDRQQDAQDFAIHAIAAGNGREAVSWMLPYRAAYPLDEKAQGLLIASLAAYEGPSAPSWVGPMLWQELETAGYGALLSAEVQLGKALDKFPGFRVPSEALVYTKTRLGKNEEALTVAEAAFRTDPNDPIRARLLFEAAVTDRNVALAEESLAQMQQSLGLIEGMKLLNERFNLGGGGLERLELRVALLRGDASSVKATLEQKVRARPEDPYYVYYLGCAEMATIEESMEPDRAIHAAYQKFEQVSLMSSNAALRERAKIAFHYAHAVARADADREPRENGGQRGGFLDMFGS